MLMRPLESPTRRLATERFPSRVRIKTLTGCSTTSCIASMIRNRGVGFPLTQQGWAPLIRQARRVGTDTRTW